MCSISLTEIVIMNPTPPSFNKCILLIYLFIAALGFELKTYTLSHSTRPFSMMGFSKIGSGELFAWAGFEPPSS
jgi:hypothetical protein